MYMGSMETFLQAFLEAIHASPVQCVLYIAGAGSSAIAHLTRVAGCSRTLLDARVCYATTVTTHMLDDCPAKMVTAAVARQLAQHAYHSAKRYGDVCDDENFVGIGATSAVQTNRTRHGKDCAFVASWCEHKVMEYAIDLPGHIGRTEQENQVALLLLKALADNANISFEPSLVVEPLINCYTLPDSLLQCVLRGEMSSVVFNVHGELRAHYMPYVTETSDVVNKNTVKKRLLFPGSFRPLHWGHTELARAASQTVAALKSQVNDMNVTTTLRTDDNDSNKVQVTYEISVCNVDKGVIGSREDLERRVHQFLQRGARVAITRASLFTEKAVLFPGHGFIVGIDTLKRILHPKYYGNCEEEMLHAMRSIQAHGCYFVVGGRALGEASDAKWEDMESINVPVELQSMFIPIRRDEFRVDVSSTALRKRSGNL